MPEVRKIEPGLRNDVFFAQQTDGSKHRSCPWQYLLWDWRCAPPGRSSRRRLLSGWGELWVDSAATVHNIRDSASHADHLTHKRIN